jgi:hypothetical protein
MKTLTVNGMVFKIRQHREILADILERDARNGGRALFSVPRTMEREAAEDYLAQFSKIAVDAARLSGARSTVRFCREFRKALPSNDDTEHLEITLTGSAILAKN